MTRRLAAAALAGLVLAACSGDPSARSPSSTDEADTPSPVPTAEGSQELPSLDPTTPAVSPEPTAAPQLRGIWAHLFDPSLKTREGITRLLDAAVAGNLNTVIVQAARRHDAFYASDVLPTTTDDELAGGLDVLAELVPAAHERGLQVHVWYSLVPSTHRTMLEEAVGDAHISNQHGFGSAEPWLQAGNDPTYGYLDPAVPGFQEHAVAMLREVVGRYDVDGIHLDYLRYECLQVADDGGCLDADAGDPATANQHPVTMQRFAAHGDGSLGDFMRAQTEDLVRRVYLEVADVDPNVVVSAALIAQGDGPGADREAFTRTKAWWNKGQDWARWVEAGIVDHAYPMAYFREGEDRWARAYDDWVAFADLLDDEDHVVAVGQAAYLNCVDQSMAQVDEATAATDGVVIYSWQGLAAEDCEAEPGELLRRLADGPFAEPAPVPAVPRKADPTAGHLLVAAEDGQQVTVTRDGDTRTRRADATGHAGFPWVAPGEWEVAVDGTAIGTTTVAVGDVSRVGG